LEAVEMAVRSAMHRAGASALTQLLQFDAPAAGQRTIPCPGGQQAHYRELRSKSLLTAVGRVEVARPYYLCPHCHCGQFPADAELDIQDTEFSPGVRRLQAVVGWVQFHFTPTSASWLNQIEIWFGILTRKTLRGGRFNAKKRLREAIEAFAQKTNENPKPFRWRKREVKGSQLRNTIVNLCN
jgi:hypothetical protein